MARRHGVANSIELYPLPHPSQTVSTLRKKWRQLRCVQQVGLNRIRPEIKPFCSFLILFGICVVSTLIDDPGSEDLIHVAVALLLISGSLKRLHQTRLTRRQAETRTDCRF